MYKVIIQGRLDFGTENTYSKALKLYIQRKEVYYKNEVIFPRHEEHFNDEKFQFLIKRYVQLSSDKYWMNTVHLLANLAQYAISGEIKMWMMNEGKAIKSEVLAPDSEKSIVAAYKKALKILDDSTKKPQLMKLLDTILEKYPTHPQALAMKGRVYAREKDAKKAFKFFDLALTADEDNYRALLWKGKFLMQLERYEDALKILKTSVEKSVAQEPIHWVGRRLKGLCNYKMERWEDCAFEWRLIAKKEFPKGDSNYYWKRAVMVGLGKASMQLGRKGEAILAFDQALHLDSLFDNISQELIEEYREQALGKAGGKKQKVPSKASVKKVTSRMS